MVLEAISKGPAPQLQIRTNFSILDWTLQCRTRSRPSLWPIASSALARGRFLLRAASKHCLGGGDCLFLSSTFMWDEPILALGMSMGPICRLTMRDGRDW
jgi:hypothetical protein